MNKADHFISSAVSPVFGGFWRRVLADLADSTLMNLAALGVALVFYGLLYGLLVLMGAQSSLSVLLLQLFQPFSEQVLFFSLRLGLSLIYFTWHHHQSGATYGKRWQGLRVVTWGEWRSLSWSQSWIRTVSYAFSYLTLGLGFLCVAFHPKKRALHDLLSSTAVVQGSA